MRAPASLNRVLTLLLPMALTLYANFNGVQLILAPLQVEAIDPAGKIQNLAWLTMICAVTGVAGLTSGGAASDATRSRWGRRSPWLAGMALGSAVLTIGLGLQHSFVGIAIFYGALWFTLNFFQAAMLAVTPDRVPASKRSLASSILGVAGPVGALCGVNLAAFAPGVVGNAVLAAALLLTTGTFVAFAREAPFLDPKPARGSVGPGRRLVPSLSLLRSFSSRDFSLAYLFRVLMFVAQFSINNYLLYILQDHIGVPDAQVAAGEISSVRTIATVTAIGIGLWIANRVERRKVFAQIYALVMAAAMFAPIVSPTWNGMLAFAVLGGLAMGVYATVDLTLMSHVLPSRDSAGRDLALLVMAGASAQFVAPWVGGGLIRYFGYDSLFIVCAFVTLLAGLAISALRSAP